ncbi:hypothetical protein SEVIR_4G080650v4 [Setaria viridis]
MPTRPLPFCLSFERLCTGLVQAADANAVGAAASRSRRWMCMRWGSRCAMRLWTACSASPTRTTSDLSGSSTVHARIDRAWIQILTVEVRFRGLNVEAECHVGT